MASVMIASQNESSWAHMGKIPYPGHNLNANPNPNSKKKLKKYHTAAGNGVAGRYHNNLDFPAVTQTASDDAYSFIETSTSRDAFSNCRYMTFNIASYMKPELVELRKRLCAELEQIRDLQDRIDSGHFRNSGNPRSHVKVMKFRGNDTLLMECKQIVAKLIKHKYGYIFKEPVNAAALGLHDYHHIVRDPMDLGTVKRSLAQNLYTSPAEFAADVRLTFNNALLYNPKHDPVHGMPEQMLARFEELFRPIQGKIDISVNRRKERKCLEIRENEDMQYQQNDELQGNSLNNHNQSRASPLLRKKVKQKVDPIETQEASRKIERMQMPMQIHSSASTSSNPPLPVLNHHPKQEQIYSHVRAPIHPAKDQKPGKVGGSVKQPKSKGKDPNKREMSMEEKQKLGIGLQSLPQEKMPQLVQIIRKRNEHLAQDSDEIELDIESLDIETLWELDRFVSKTKRQALMMNNEPATGIAAPSTPSVEADMGLISEKNDDSVKKLEDNEDEDVDIDDDTPATIFPPVEIEKDEGAGIGGGQYHDHDDHDNACSRSSNSSSSRSDYSSSSGSSSGSDSDADDAQS